MLPLIVVTRTVTRVFCLRKRQNNWQQEFNPTTTFRLKLFIHSFTHTHTHTYTQRERERERERERPRASVLVLADYSSGWHGVKKRNRRLRPTSATALEMPLRRSSKDNRAFLSLFHVSGSSPLAWTDSCLWPPLTFSVILRSTSSRVLCWCRYLFSVLPHSGLCEVFRSWTLSHINNIVSY